MQEARPFFQAAPQLPPAAPTVPKPAPWAALPLLLQGAGADRDPTDLLGKGRISAGALMLLPCSLVELLPQAEGLRPKLTTRSR